MLSFICSDSNVQAFGMLGFETTKIKLNIKRKNSFPLIIFNILLSDSQMEAFPISAPSVAGRIRGLVFARY